MWKLQFMLLILCVSSLSALGVDLDWNNMEGKDLSEHLGERPLGPINYVFKVPNGQITKGGVRFKGVWLWSGSGAEYKGVVTQGDDATSAEHCGWFSGEYVAPGNGEGDPLKWKAQLKGCGADHWGIYHPNLPAAPDPFPAPGFKRLIEYNDGGNKVALLYTPSQTIKYKVTDLKPIVGRTTKISLIRSQHGGSVNLGGNIKGVSAGVEYNYQTEKSDSMTVDFDAPDDDRFTYMIAGLQTYFTNTLSWTFYQLRDKFGNNIPADVAGKCPFPTTPYGIDCAWVPVNASSNEVSDYVGGNEGWIIYSKTRRHGDDCEYCAHYFQGTKHPAVPREPANLF